MKTQTERLARNEANRRAGEICYAAAHAEVLARLQSLIERIDDAPAPGNGPDWCHAASMNFVADRLGEILEFVGGERCQT